MGHEKAEQAGLATPVVWLVFETIKDQHHLAATAPRHSAEGVTQTLGLTPFLVEAAVLKFYRIGQRPLGEPLTDAKRQLR